MFIPFPSGDWMDSQEMPNKRRKKSSQKFAFAFAMLSGFCITKALNAN